MFRVNNGSLNQNILYSRWTDFDTCLVGCVVLGDSGSFKLNRTLIYLKIQCLQRQYVSLSTAGNYTMGAVHCKHTQTVNTVAVAFFSSCYAKTAMEAPTVKPCSPFPGEFTP